MKLQKYQVLSDAEVKQIHAASLRVLERTGMEILDDRLLEILAAAGATVDKGSHRVTIPARLVEQALSSVPSTITMHTRRGEPCMELGSGRAYAASGHNAVFVADSLDGKDRRPSTKQDIENFARLSDALDNLSMVGIEAMPQDVMPAASLVHAADAAFSGTTKPIYFSPESAEVTAAIIKIADAVAGGKAAERPVAICQLSPTSPLTWETGAAAALIEVAESGIPFAILPEPYTGVSAPYTLAGILVIHNSEMLASIVMQQLINKGAPAIYAGAWTNFDMRRASVAIGTPEAALLRCAGSQMAKLYRMPCHCIGPDTDAQCLDEQMAWEKMMTALCSLGGGIDLIVNAGMFATGMTVSTAQLVLDNEMLGMVLRLLQGIEVSEETLAVDVIEEVGPRGDFLATEHTIRHLRTGEHWLPDVSNRVGFDVWLNAGGRTVAETAQERAQDLLGSHTVEPLPDDVCSAIRSIIDDFEAEARERG